MLSWRHVKDCSAAPIPNRSDGTVQATGTDEHLVGDEKTFVATVMRGVVKSHQLLSGHLVRGCFYWNL